MEDVQQRQQRLAAMREQAAVEDGSDAKALETAPANSLSLPNPMMETQTIDAVETNKASGFDFYTDPLTAFTSGKRRKAGVGGPLSVAPPVGHGGIQSPHWQQAPQPHPVYYPPPMGFPPPPPPGGHGWQPIPYHAPPGAGPPPYVLGQEGDFSYQSSGRGIEVGFGSRGRGMYRPAGGRGDHGSQFSTQGRGHSGGSNNSWNSGRGVRSPGGYPSRGGQARGSQGRGGHRGGNSPSAKEQPHLYYKKSMVEDPWKALEQKLRKS